MKNTIIILCPSLILLALVLFSSQTYPVNSTVLVAQSDSDTSKWIAPDSVNAFVNPIDVNDATIKEGSGIYRKHCRSCHGRLGDGKGTGASNISSEVTDFTNPEFHEQSDGSMFWKISEGKDDMDPYKKKLYEEEIWTVVNFIKTFAPQKQTVPEK
jgi:mono/diheme cytochrome c family protein